MELTKKEYSLLEYLIYHQEQIVSIEDMIEHIWESEVDLFSNSCKFHIHSLKKKLSSVLGEHEMIRNIRGQGYMITSLSGKEVNS
ncbi:Phosphate regulon transcriptional regulatory protein PhoB [compost metagenome]